MESLVAQLAALPLAYLSVAMLAATGVPAVLRDWRLSVAGLAVQYIAVCAVLARFFARELSFSWLVVGLTVSAALLLSAWQRELARQSASKGTPSAPQAHHRVWDVEASMSRAFRLVVVLLAGIGTYDFSHSYPLIVTPSEVNVLIYWLFVIGVLMLVTRIEPLGMGIGLLTVYNGLYLLALPLTRDVQPALLTVVLSFSVLLVTLATASALVRSAAAPEPADAPLTADQ